MAISHLFSLCVRSGRLSRAYVRTPLTEALTASSFPMQILTVFSPVLVDEW